MTLCDICVFGCGVIDLVSAIEVFRDLYWNYFVVCYWEDFYGFDEFMVLLLMNIYHFDIGFRIWKFMICFDFRKKKFR